MKRTLGTCYYPEHWSPKIWAEDAQRMAELGLTWVRIGEFAWSKIEPSPGDLQFEWLDEAIDILGAAGLQVVLGTPTATPPRWMVDRYPDMLAVDAQGRPRNFGSRRHYCFSHEGYRHESARIVTLLAESYGANPHVAAWQTDNEYGCHDTTLSYSPAAKTAFQGWLRARYPGQGNDGDIELLNAAWGNVFWSMEYNDFDQIDLPNLTVTQPNPAHELDFRRFSSEQVVSFNRLQVDILRRHTKAPIAHNYMGRTTDFDHFAVGKDLDIASWDSYPLGFLEDRVAADAAYKRRFMRQGDPDFQAFHHDLYRAVGKGRWWVMEQQPGPVNWAPYNPAPLPGMVRLWTWEAFAHGAEAVCYFRWRQAPLAQELLHAGLLRPFSVIAPSHLVAAQVMKELPEAPDVAPRKAPIALIFDYQAHWMWEILPQGRGLSYFELIFENYRALRSLGLSIDILPPDADFDGYKMIVAPGLMHANAGLKERLATSGVPVILGPRCASSDQNCGLTLPLGPDWPGLDVTVARAETLRPDAPIALANGGAIGGWKEVLEGSATPFRHTTDGETVAVNSDHVFYLGGWFDFDAMRSVFAEICASYNVATADLPEGLRRRETGSEVFWFNYAPESIELDGRDFEALSVTRDPL